MIVIGCCLSILTRGLSRCSALLTNLLTSMSGVACSPSPSFGWNLLLPLYLNGVLTFRVLAPADCHSLHLAGLLSASLGGSPAACYLSGPCVKWLLQPVRTYWLTYLSWPVLWVLSLNSKEAKTGDYSVGIRHHSPIFPPRQRFQVFIISAKLNNQQTQKTWTAGKHAYNMCNDHLRHMIPCIVRWPRQYHTLQCPSTHVPCKLGSLHPKWASSNLS